MYCCHLLKKKKTLILSSYIYIFSNSDVVFTLYDWVMGLWANLSIFSSSSMKLKNIYA